MSGKICGHVAGQGWPAIGQHFSVWRAWRYVRVYGVSLEVRLHRLVMGENGRRESGKNAMVVNATTGIRIWYWRRGDIGGRECLSKIFS